MKSEIPKMGKEARACGLTVAIWQSCWDFQSEFGFAVALRQIADEFRYRSNAGPLRHPQKLESCGAEL